MCIEHQQFMPCICKVWWLLPDNQVVNAANCKKQWYSLAKWQIVLTLIAINVESQKCHKMKATFVTKVITTINPHAKGWPWWGRKAAATSRSPYNRCLKVQRTSGKSLLLPLICVVLVMQEQMPNVTSNTAINVVRRLNVSKCPCHVMITMTVTATIIVMYQHMHTTIAPLQLN